jgi:hypothetical protein
MGFLEVEVGSYIVKNMDEFQKFMRKVEQCSTFERGKGGIKLEL